ncbi:MAG: hypothetical protein JWM78_3893 [Verrucomicrobiaceae bacterium]|nr:hypothetical protein [Verrucomicrobiaceae bacterium]
MKFIGQKIGFLLLTVSLAPTGFASSKSVGQTDSSVSTTPRAQGDPNFLDTAGYFEWGPVRIYPALSTALGYDSNIFESDRHEQSSTVTRVTPEVSALLPFNAGFFAVGAQVNDVRYLQSSDDDFTDRLIFIKSAFEANDRNQFNVNGQFAKQHDARGTVLTEGFDPEETTVSSPDQYTDQKLGVNYEFGATGAQGRLRFGASFLDHSYDNHRDRTRYFDRDEYGASVAFLWRVQPNTSLVLEDRETRVWYGETKPDSASLDSREQSLLVGTEWGVTESTHGSVRVGHQRKNFDDTGRVDGSDTIWEVNVTWAPLTYSKFDFLIERTPNETNGTGDFIDTRTSKVGWTHDWTSRIGTRLALVHMLQTYENADRESRIESAQFGVNYKMRRWLTWRLDGTWSTRSSNVDILDFERNRYWITAEFTL